MLKRKVQDGNIQIELEAKLNKFSLDIAASLEQNEHLTKRLVKTKEELKKSL